MIYQTQFDIEKVWFIIRRGLIHQAHLIFMDFIDQIYTFIYIIKNVGLINQIPT